MALRRAAAIAIAALSAAAHSTTGQSDGAARGAGSGVTATETSYTIDSSTLGPRWDGLGADFSAGSARLILDYAEPYRGQMLDFLFAEPSQVQSTVNTGAALAIIKLSIGSDANEGHGVEPSHKHGRYDTPNMARGWAGTLAKEAFTRNAKLKVMLTLRGVPGWLGAGGGSTDPLAAPADVATYVTDYVQAFSTTYAPVAYVGVFAGLRATVTASTIAYVKALRAALDGAGLTGVGIVCADASDWACADAAAGDAALLAAVAVVGNAGLTLPPSAAGLGKPLWVSSYGNWQTTSAGAIGLVAELMRAFVASGGVIGGAMYDFGASAVPYGWPNWHTGLVQATQPWSGHYYVSPALWGVAHINQFLPPTSSWAATKVGSGSGALTDGGFYMSFVDTTTPDSQQLVLIVAKFKSADSDDTSDTEVATFTLAGALANRGFTQLYGYYSNFGYEVPDNTTLFAPIDAVPVTNNMFTVTLRKKGLYSFTTVPDSAVHKGCGSIACYTQPPEPAPFPYELDYFDNCEPGAPAAYFTDINGAFECVPDDTYTTALQQTASGAPLGSYTDTRPHTLAGDVTLADVDVSVSFKLPGYSGTALLGARVTPWNLTRAGTNAANALDRAPGVWLAVDTSGWAVYGDLSSLDSPLASGQLPIPTWSYGVWAYMRLAVSGPRAIGFFYQSSGGSDAANASAAAAAAGAAAHTTLRGARGEQPPQPHHRPAAGETVRVTRRDGSTLDAAVLFNIDVSALPTAGFAGLGTGAFDDAVSFHQFEVSISRRVCTDQPVAGQLVELELCSPAPGQGFDFVLVDMDPTHIVYNKISGYDAEKADSGDPPANCDPPDYKNMQAACNANGTACAGFNRNCWPKGNLLTLAQTGLTDLYVKQLPAGQFKSRAQNSLCLARGTGGLPPLSLAPCAAGDATQLWVRELTSTDGAYVTGPITSVLDGNVIDVEASSSSIDAKIEMYHFYGTPNQIIEYSDRSGLIRFAQTGLCLGACAYM